VFQRWVAFNRLLRPLLALAGRDFPLPTPVERAILAPQRPGIWRMSDNEAYFKVKKILAILLAAVYPVLAQAQQPSGFTPLHAHGITQAPVRPSPQIPPLTLSIPANVPLTNTNLSVGAGRPFIVRVGGLWGCWGNARRSSAIGDTAALAHNPSRPFLGISGHVDEYPLEGAPECALVIYVANKPGWILIPSNRVPGNLETYQTTITSSVSGVLGFGPNDNVVNDNTGSLSVGVKGATPIPVAAPAKPGVQQTAQPARNCTIQPSSKGNSCNLSRAIVVDVPDPGCKSSCPPHSHGVCYPFHCTPSQTIPSQCPCAPGD
jgi:hypothetical protein